MRKSDPAEMLAGQHLCRLTDPSPPRANRHPSELADECVSAGDEYRVVASRKALMRWDIQAVLGPPEDIEMSYSRDKLRPFCFLVHKH
ncbi:hypothetical protein EYF80_015760 [Liparis tanakae]|uniref:Uncharacterized protein n=1 Tax=Liparis tanakae TaxID=230148 RepID=A0A4Z2I7W8_9TELE|nr:hypothetical protein EYF80_015760 [Liparis tanakae]